MGEGMKKLLRIYCDTDTLPHNIRHDDKKTQGELAALKRLAEEQLLFGSLEVRREVMKTRKQSQQDNLIVDYKALKPITKDERVHGFHTQTDQFGGFITQPLISDVQDEALRNELVNRGLKLNDANHITQAVCNNCDVYLTRDEDTIIKPHRAWLEIRLGIKIRLPSELLEELLSMHRA